MKERPGGGRPRQADPAPKKLNANLTLRMHARGEPVSAIARAHWDLGIPLSTQAVRKFLARWAKNTAPAPTSSP